MNAGSNPARYRRSTKRIAIVGSTGTLERRLVDAVRAAGHIPRMISRGSGVDLLTGAGLVEALDGAAAVIDAFGAGSARTTDGVSFLATVTRNLLSAERAAVVPHHVTISIIGATMATADFYTGRPPQEQLLMADRRAGWSMLRTTEFHEFVHQVLRTGRMGPFQTVPKVRSRPIAAAEVAAELVAIAAGEPQGFVPVLAGPREERWPDLVRSYLATQRHLPVIEIGLPGEWGRAARDGTLLPGPGTRLGTQTFDRWLTTQPRAARPWSIGFPRVSSRPRRR